MSRSFSPLGDDEALGVVALSGPAEPSGLDRGLEALLGMGRRVLVAPNVRARSSLGYLAGEDDRRLEGLRWVLDAGARILVAVRGGYGVARLLPRLPWDRLVAERVTFVGFSDLTALLNPLAARGGVIQVHGPMVAFGMEKRRVRRRLFDVLDGPPAAGELFRFSGRGVVRPGRARGHVVGGNLTVLCSLLGTPYEPDWDGAVLFLEEVNEPIYRLDRLLTHLRTAGRLTNVRAVVGGSLRGCHPAGERDDAWDRLLKEAAPVGVPIIVGLPFGHGARNLAFPIGAEVELDTEDGRILWRG